MWPKCCFKITFLFIFLQTWTLPAPSRRFWSSLCRCPSSVETAHQSVAAECVSHLISLCLWVSQSPNLHPVDPRCLCSLQTLEILTKSKKQWLTNIKELWYVTCDTVSLDVRAPRPSCCRITLCMTTRVPLSWFQGLGFLLSMTSFILKYSRLHSVGNTIMVSTIYFQICHYFPAVPDVEPLLWPGPPPPFLPSWSSICWSAWFSPPGCSTPETKQSSSVKNQLWSCDPPIVSS